MVEAVARHKTAISRTELSRPVKQAMGDGVIREGRTILDYGCGLGGDVARLRALGYDGSGWDPVHLPDGELRRACVVNLGYIVNVIEHPLERREVLKKAWSYASDVLIVSARLTMEMSALRRSREFRDGKLTALGTFQKFFDQSELREWIDTSLGVSSVPAAPGVVYVFRDDGERAAFLASRYRRAPRSAPIPNPESLFDKHGELLAEIMEFVLQRGRIPEEDEIREVDAVKACFGSIRRAFRVVVDVTGAARWERIAEERREDLLVYLALSNFGWRPRAVDLPSVMKRDVAGLFGTFRDACRLADALLYSLGKPGAVAASAEDAVVGKRTPTALYVHSTALDLLPPMLRVLEGCARQLVGTIKGANVFKLYIREPKVSYLGYPTFDDIGHPALSTSVAVNLQTFKTTFRSYAGNVNVPILHRKELFVGTDHPLREDFAKLTLAEEQAGLYADTQTIGTQTGWDALLGSLNLRVEGHRLRRGAAS